MQSLRFWKTAHSRCGNLSIRLCSIASSTATSGLYAPLPEFSPQPLLRPLLPPNALVKNKFTAPSALMNAVFLTNDDKERDNVAFKLKDGVLIIQLRPSDEGRRLSWSMQRLIIKALQQALSSDEVKGVLLTGTGNVFCGGSASVDPKLIAGGKKEIITTSCNLMQELVDALIRLSKPKVLAVNGSCHGFLFKAFPLFHRVVAVDNCSFSTGGGPISKKDVCCSSVTFWPKAAAFKSAQVDLKQALKYKLVHVSVPLDALFDTAMMEVNSLLLSERIPVKLPQTETLLEANKNECHKLLQHIQRRIGERPTA